MLHHPSRASRRTTLVAAAAGLALAGCASGSDDDAAGPAPADDADDAGPDDAGNDDEQVLDRVVAALGAAASLLDRTRGEHPSLSRELRPLDRLHRAHLAEIDRDVTVGTATPPPRPAAARALVLTTERALQRTLVTASLEVDSGRLAGLLASMAASVAQHRTALGVTP